METNTKVERLPLAKTVLDRLPELKPLDQTVSLTAIGLFVEMVQRIGSVGV